MMKPESDHQESNNPICCPICYSQNNFKKTKIFIADGTIYHCNVCLGYFLFPPKIVTYNNSGWSESRKKSWESDVKRANHFAPAIKGTIEKYLDRSISTVLEIGCSSAFMGMGFRNSGCKYTGIEIDAESIEFAKEKGIDAYCIPAEEISQIMLPNEKYDVIISANVFEHLDDPMKTLRDLKSICSGAIIVIVPNANGLFHRLSVYKSLRWLNQLILRDKREIVYSIDGYWHNKSFSLQTLVYLCNQTDLKIIRISPMSINDPIFGFVQPNQSLWYRLISNFAGLVSMDSEIILIAEPQSF